MSPDPSSTVKLSPQLLRDCTEAGGRMPVELASQYARILDKINLLWPRREVLQYIDELMVTDRASRAGFPLEVASELIYLKEVHAFRYPAHEATQSIHERVNRPQGRWRDAGVAPPAGLQRRTGWGEIKDLEGVRAFALNKMEGRMPKRRRLGEILIEYGVITQDVLEQAVRRQKDGSGGFPSRLGTVLVQMRAITEVDVTKALAVQSGFALLDLDAIPMTDEAVKAMPERAARQCQTIPLVRVKGWLVVATDDPFDGNRRSSASFAASSFIELAWAEHGAIVRRLENYFPGRVYRK